MKAFSYEMTPIHIGTLARQFCYRAIKDALLGRVCARAMMNGISALPAKVQEVLENLHQDIRRYSGKPFQVSAVSALGKTHFVQKRINIRRVLERHFKENSSRGYQSMAPEIWHRCLALNTPYFFIILAKASS